MLIKRQSYRLCWCHQMQFPSCFIHIFQKNNSWKLLLIVYQAIYHEVDGAVQNYKEPERIVIGPIWGDFLVGWFFRNRNVHQRKERRTNLITKNRWVKKIYHRRLLRGVIVEKTLLAITVTMNQLLHMFKCTINRTFDRANPEYGNTRRQFFWGVHRTLF